MYQEEIDWDVPMKRSYYANWIKKLKYSPDKSRSATKWLVRDAKERLDYDNWINGSTVKLLHKTIELT